MANYISVMHRDDAFIGYFDGACELGYSAGYGFVIYDQNNNALIRGYGHVEMTTNNIAEYTGLIRLMQKARELKIETIVIRGDSQLVINQMTGKWSVRSSNLLKPNKMAKELVSKFKKVTFEWVPRELNREADDLSKMGMQAF